MFIFRFTFNGITAPAPSITRFTFTPRAYATDLAHQDDSDCELRLEIAISLHAGTAARLVVPLWPAQEEASTISTQCIAMVEDPPNAKEKERPLEDNLEERRQGRERPPSRDANGT